MTAKLYRIYTGLVTSIGVMIFLNPLPDPQPFFAFLIASFIFGLTGVKLVAEVIPVMQLSFCLLLRRSGFVETLLSLAGFSFAALFESKKGWMTPATIMTGTLLTPLIFAEFHRPLLPSLITRDGAVTVSQADDYFWPVSRLAELSTKDNVKTCNLSTFSKKPT